MRNLLPLLFLPALAGCHDPALVRLQVVNDSQEQAVAIAVRCDGRLVFDTVVARYRTTDDRLSRYLRLAPGPHRLAVEARGQRTHLDTLLNTVGTNVLGVTFRYDSLPARTRTTYFADGAEGEITFPAFYVRRSFRVYQFQTSQPLRP
ncbi:hypothetical protein E5K00_11190 [Hymenobacter aquaticus]|uniref:DUF4397 domain-containing protein n=1 Tax=Hymenobacter aquaticus TaxID=1867101 RepID=A0A4Z0Q7R8_9BACT|nr:hypothetical protein [Hymenobacter aquaticus]TGE25724.1 hypothetical protein E5K00_11190 [Hymenobacter aquaticus]